MNQDDNSKDFLTIAEFASIVGISADMLRHYDKKGIFSPDKLGVEYKNNYRFYAPTQITAIKMIRVLGEIGVSLDDIKELSDNRNPEKLMKLLSKHKGLVLDEMNALQDVYSVISTFHELLVEGMCANESEITLSEKPERKRILGEVNDFSSEDSFFREYLRFCNEPHEPKLNLSYPIGGYWCNMDSFLDEPSHPTHFFSLDPNGKEKQPAGLYLTGYTRGYYGHTNDLPERMVEYADRNGLEFSGPVYNLYLFDELSIDDTEQYLLQVTSAVKDTTCASYRRSMRR
jgi:DNA-binding transcriptional MerR regulator